MFSEWMKRGRKYLYSERGEKYVEQIRNGGVLGDKKNNPQRGSFKTGREYAESIRRNLRQEQAEQKGSAKEIESPVYRRGNHQWILWI